MSRQALSSPLGWLTLALKLLVAAFFLLLLTVMVHEMGHALAAKRLAGMEAEVYIWPGYQIYPEVGTRFDEEWPSTPGLTKLYPPVPQSISVTRLLDGRPFPAHRTPSINLFTSDSLLRYGNLIAFMGSGATAILSLLFLLTMALLEPRGLAKWLFATGALLHDSAE